MSAALFAAPVAALLAGTALRVDRLPDWSRRPVLEAETQTPPAEAEVWVLLQATDLVYAGGGQVNARQRRVVRVLTERGIDEERLLSVSGLGGSGSRLKRLNAWNARPDGEVEQRTRDDAYTLDFGNTRFHALGLQRIMKGSVLAFETVLETEHPMGPFEILHIMESQPVRRWSLTARSERPSVEVQIDARHVVPWLPRTNPQAGMGVAFSDVPARPPEEAAAPHDRNVLPWLLVRFHDPSLRDGAPSSVSWDTLATWTQAAYASRLAVTPQLPAAAGDAREALRAIHDWIVAQTTYRQVYLTPDRGWIPSPAADVARRRYGDCKDLATLLISEARAAGFRAYPALARVSFGWIEDGEPPGVAAFNHAIAAVRLPETLGLPAEVETPQGRFLLMDPTARFVPFGRLPAAHAGRRVLVCTEVAGVWVEVPEGATESPLRRYRLDGKLLASRRFEGTLEVREEGVPGGLRNADLEGGDEALRRACLDLGLPAEARCEIKEHTDPLRQDVPYTVAYVLQFDNALEEAERGQWRLGLPGLPKIPRSLVAPGRARALPLWFEGRSSVHIEAHLETPLRIAAVTPRDARETPFGTYESSIEVESVQDRCRLDLWLAHKQQPRAFEFDQREAGLAAWKEERAAVQRLRETALALRIQ